MIERRIRVRFTSDWAVGSGQGQPGGADRTVQRDADGLPFVPRSSLRGVLRDAVEELAWALDGGREDGWSALASSLFGRRLVGAGVREQPGQAPVGSRVVVGDLRLTEPVLGALAGEQGRWRRAVLVSERPAVAIDDATGTAADHQLRFLEVARSGLELEGGLELDTAGLDEDQLAASLALLDGGCRMVRAIGADRQRGLGRCRVSLLDEPTGEAAHRRRLSGPAPASLPARVPTGRGGDVLPEAERSWRELRLELEVETPLIAAAGTRGNVVVCHDHLPARALLPVVAELLTAADLDVPGLLRSGQVRISPALPGRAGAAAIPNPRCLVRDRVSEQPGGPVATNLAHADAVVADGPSKVAADGYLADPDGAAVLVHAEHLVTTHNVIDRERGRPDALAGGVYSYEAIAPGTVLAATLLIDAAVVAVLDARTPGWRDALRGTRRLGTARRAGYGQVQVTVHDEPGVAAPELSSDRAHLLLLTAPMVAGSDSRPVPPTPEALLVGLRDALIAAGADPALVVEPAPLEHGRWSWLSVSRSDGWSAADGLPLPSTVSIDAGAVVRLRPSVPVRAEVVAAAQATGIGARRTDGAGWFVIDPPVLAAPRRELARPSGSSPQPQAAPPPLQRNRDIALVEQLDRQAADRRLLPAALLIGRDAEWRQTQLGWDGPVPGRSQLGSLRAALDADDPARLVQWIQQRQQDIHRFADDRRPGRWNEELLTRIVVLRDDPVAAVGERAQQLGIDITQLLPDASLAHRFARLVLLAAATAFGGHDDADTQPDTAPAEVEA